MKSNPIRFVPCVMFVWFVVTVVMVVVTNNAHAERQTCLKNGVLTVMVDVIKVVDVPKEITDAEVAFKLATGQLKEAKIDGKVITYHPYSGVQYVSPWKVKVTE